MKVQPTYEELERRVQELEKIVSEHKYSKEELREDENLFKRLYEKAPLGYQSLNENGHFMVVNKTWLETLGYAEEEVIGKSFADFLHPDWRDHFKENFPRFKAIGEILGVEFEMVKKNGDLILVSFTGKIGRDEKGNFQQTHCIFHDITERKQAETTLRQSEEKFRTLVKTAPFGIQLTDLEGRIVYSNPAHNKIQGYGPYELIGMYIWDLMANGSHRAKAREYYQTIISKKPEPTVYFNRARTGDGREIDVQINWDYIRNEKDEVTGIISIIDDITERKQAEVALRESEEQFRVLIQNLQSAVALVNERGVFTIVNQAFLRIFELNDDSSIKKVNDRDWSQWQVFDEHGTLLDVDEHPVRKAALKGRPVRDQLIAVKAPANPKIKWLLVSAEPILDSQGHIYRLICTYHDITERLLVEQALKESDKQFRALADSIPNLAWWANGDGYITWYNQRWYEYTGTTPSQMEGWGWQSVHDPVELPKVLERWQASIATGEPFEMTFPLLGADGVFRPFLTRVIPLKDGAGRVQQWFGTNTDVSELKRFEQALRESEALYRGIGESIDYGVWVCAPDGRNTYASESFLKMVGITQEQCSNLGWGEALHPDDAERTIAAWQECVSTGGNWDMEHRFRGADGKWNYVLARGVPVRNENGKIIRWVGINLDISKIKQTEQALRESEKRLGMVLKASSIGTFEVDLHSGEGQWNEVEYELLGLKPGEAPSTPETFFQYVHRNDVETVKAKWEDAVEYGELDMEFRILRADGQERWVAGKGRFLYDGKENNQAMRFLGVNFDITKRKQAEVQVTASLAEKEVMLREIHHRVKNNLQVISSLVSLQADNLTDEQTRDALNDVRDRVRTMALVHEKLYQTSDLARLNFADYTTSLVRSLWHSHSTLAGKARLNLELTPLELSVEAAVPCGLILNELVSNALKYAFPNSSDGEVTVGLEHDAATGTVCLRVRDNGVGLPAGLVWRQSRSLGLRLVQILTGQLHGTVETVTGTGTEFRVTFPLNRLQS